MHAAKPTYDKLIFELSSPGRFAYSLPESDVPDSDPAALLPREHLRETPAELPEVSEVDVVRHYSRLSQMNYGVDTHFYPLGSCTMKYNPKINEDMARLRGASRACTRWFRRRGARARSSSCGSWPGTSPRSRAWTRCRCSPRRERRASWPAC